MDSTIAEGLGADDPREIGPFTIIGLLGTGGMGEVYLGTSETGYVAVKRVRPRLVSGERFQREVGLLYRVPEGVGPGVLASDSTASRPWFATEYVPGLTVDEAVRLRGPLPADALWLLLRETAGRLRAVHEAGIVHRDLKPANVMIVRDGVKLIDFGIARAVDQARLTRTGGSYGTRGFTAPEQENGDEAVGPPADIFSLAALLLYAASGRTPGLVPDVEAMRSVDDDLATVIESCLAADPEARPTAASLADAAGAHVSSAAWPEELTERIAIRFAFAATPVSRMETLPPPDVGPVPESASESASVPAQVPAPTDDAAAISAAGPSAPAPAAPAPSSIDPTRKSHRSSRRRTLLLLPVAAVLVIAGIAAFVLMPSSSTPSHLAGQSTGVTTSATSPASGQAQTSTTSASPTSSTSPSAHTSGAGPETEGTTALPGGGSGTSATSPGGATTTRSSPAPGGVHPTSSSIAGVSGGDDKTQVPGSEADADWVGNDAACSAWLDDDGSGGLAGVLNTSLTQSCVAELYRSDGVHYTFSASWGAQKTDFIPVGDDTMWICVWHADDQSNGEACSPHFAMSGTTPVRQ